MVLVQLFSIVLVLLSKLALNTGMQPFVLLAYRNLIGAAAVAPLAFFFERFVHIHKYICAREQFLEISGTLKSDT
jgi:hypothetical protein